MSMPDEPITSKSFTGDACNSYCKQEKLYFRADATQHCTIVKGAYLGFSRGFALHDSSAVGLPCASASTPHRLASLPFGRVACLGLAKTMALAECI